MVNDTRYCLGIVVVNLKNNVGTSSCTKTYRESKIAYKVISQLTNCPRDNHIGTACGTGSHSAFVGGGSIRIKIAPKEDHVVDVCGIRDDGAPADNVVLRVVGENG